MEPKLRVVFLACRQACPNPALLSQPLQEAGLATQVVPEPCSSKVEAFQLLRILAQGADLVWVVCCPESDCQLLEGSARLSKRLAWAQTYLEEIGLEKDRLGLSKLPAGDRAALQAVVSAVKSQTRSLGPNPAGAASPAGKE